MVQIDKDAAPLIYAARGGWRYAKYPTGRIAPEPIKDINSDPSDAFGYGPAPCDHLEARRNYSAATAEATRASSRTSSRRSGSGP